MRRCASSACFISEGLKLADNKVLFIAFFTFALLAGCSGTPKPASYGADWKPVHAYTAQVEKTLLVVPHVYRALPSDKTLRGLLARWSQEAGASLDYASAYDFSLVVHVNAIRSKDLEGALKELQAIYAPHGAEIAWRRNISTIAVRDMHAAASSKPGGRDVSVKKP